MDEKLKILQLVREGKVNPEQGLELLDAIGEGSAPKIVEDFVGHDTRGEARHLRIPAVSRKGNITFNIPLGIIRFADRLFPSRFFIKINDSQLAADEVMERIYRREKGIIYKDEEESVVLELV